MVVFPDAAAQELNSRFPHARGRRLEAVQELAGLGTVQVAGTCRGIRSQLPPERVKDDHDGDQGGGDDDPAAGRGDGREDRAPRPHSLRL